MDVLFFLQGMMISFSQNSVQSPTDKSIYIVSALTLHLGRVVRAFLSFDFGEPFSAVIPLCHIYILYMYVYIYLKDVFLKQHKGKEFQQATTMSESLFIDLH